MSKPNPMPHAHTPGTWVVSKFKGRAFGDKLYIEASEGGFIADLQYDECATDSERELAEANARLIAAAPAMLEALKGLLEAVENETPDCLIVQTGSHDAAINARRAITRATGRERGA